MLERHGDALLQIGGIRRDDVRAGRLAELPQDVRDRRVVTGNVHEPGGDSDHGRGVRAPGLRGRARGSGGRSQLHRRRLPRGICGIVKLVKVDFVGFRCRRRGRRGLCVILGRFFGKRGAAQRGESKQDVGIQFHGFAPLSDFFPASPGFSKYFARTGVSFSLFWSDNPS